MSALRYLTAGESHGRGLVGIIDGIPAGVPLSVEDLHADLRRRKLGYGRGNRQKIETDEVEIVSGVRHGSTMGSPISLLLWNRDWRAWTEIMAVEPIEGDVRRRVTVPRPGHADRVGGIKYQHDDMRNVLERSSARETAMRVGLGAVARTFLAQFGISIASRVTRIGATNDPSALDVPVAELNARVDASPVRVLEDRAAEAMIAEIEAAKRDGDTLGGFFEVYAHNVPVALGGYAQWDRRLEGDVGRAFMSLNAIKGVELGLGFAQGTMLGSDVHDEFVVGDRGKTAYTRNNAGGIEGGMTTGQDIVVRAAMKPISTLMRPLRSVDLTTGEATNAHIERSDTCAVPAAAVIGEALLALVLAEALLEKFGGDSVTEINERVLAWEAYARTR